MIAEWGVAGFAAGATTLLHDELAAKNHKKAQKQVIPLFVSSCVFCGQSVIRESVSDTFLRLGVQPGHCARAAGELVGLDT
jgi:hypothetical protein